MKKFLIATALAALVTAGAGMGISQAKGGGNGQGNSDHGLCTAYFNGQKNGWAKNGTPPPFQNLETRADQSAGNNDGTATTQEVADFCDGMVGGNPAHGRYPGCFDNDDNTPCE